MKLKKYIPRQGRRSATWTVEGCEGLRIRRQPDGWQVNYAYFLAPWEPKLQLDSQLRDQRFPTRRQALESFRLCAGLAVAGAQNGEQPGGAADAGNLAALAGEEQPKVQQVSDHHQRSGASVGRSRQCPWPVR